LVAIFPCLHFGILTRTLKKPVRSRECLEASSESAGISFIRCLIISCHRTFRLKSTANCRLRGAECRVSATRSHAT
jgi:hypothetical protein